MLNLTITADMEKRMLPFLKKGSKVKIVIDPFSNPKTAQVQIDLKDGLSMDMVDAIGSTSFVLNFDSATDSTLTEDAELAVRKPALPHVESDYDEVRDSIGSDLGSPVQTLFSQKQIINRSQANQRTQQVVASKKPSQKSSFVVPDPDPIPDKKPVVETDQMQIMMKQMQDMMKQIQAMKSGQPVSVDAQAESDVEENFESIMNAQDFFSALSEAGDDIPDIDLSKKLSKEEAVELEKYKIKMPAYVVSNKGLLFIDDVGISVKQSLACNLSSIPIFKLKKSSDLIRCLKNGMLKFVDYKTAKTLSERADLTSATEGADSKLKTYLGSDGSGIETAFSTPIDVTPGASDESASDRILHRASMGRATDGIIVDDVRESDIDEQSDLINLTGGDIDREADASEALAASERDRGRQVSKTWKPATRLE